MSQNKPKTLVALLGTLAIAICVSACSSTPKANPLTRNIAPDALVVVIDDPRGETRRRGIGPGYAVRLSYEDDPLLHRRAEAIAVDHALSILAEWPLRNLGVHCFVVSKPSAQQVAALRDDNRVRWVQPFNEFSTQLARQAPGDGAIIERFMRQVSEGGDGVTIAVVDTAVDRAHPDLRRSDVSSQNFAGARGTPQGESHGTAVVGLISAVPQSSDGVAGLAQEANVHLLRGCWQDENNRGRCNTLTLALALDAAVDLNPEVLNLSLSGSRDRILDELLGKLLDNGTLVVAAFDEKRKPAERFPSPRPGVVYAYGADSGTPPAKLPNVFYAPRHAVSLAPMGAYDVVSGHSVATPQLAALAARLMDRHQDATRNQIVAALEQWLAPMQEVQPQAQ